MATIIHQRFIEIAHVDGWVSRSIRTSRLAKTNFRMRRHTAQPVACSTLRIRINHCQSYFARAGSVVYVCATTLGMRIPSAPICAPAGVSNSIVPRMVRAA